MRNPVRKLKQERSKILHLYNIWSWMMLAWLLLEVMEAMSAVAGFNKKDAANPPQLFRGINVILVGDFHQFPLPH